MESLIERIRERALDPERATDEIEVGKKGKPIERTAAPPVTLDYLANAEKVLGFSIPALLQASLFAEIGNGGFGPGHGIFNLPTTPGNEKSSSISRYMDRRDSNAKRRWPVGLLPLCDWGHGIGSYVDCSRIEAPVVRVDENMPKVDVPERIPVTWRFDKDADVPDACWVESTSLERWLTDWVDGKLLFYQAYGEPEDDDNEDNDDDGDE